MLFLWFNHLQTPSLGRRAFHHKVPVPERSNGILVKSPTLSLGVRSYSPWCVFIILWNIQGAKHAIPNTRNCSEISIPVFLQVTVVDMVHGRALQPFLQPARITELYMVMPE